MALTLYEVNGFTINIVCNVLMNELITECNLYKPVRYYEINLIKKKIIIKCYQEP